MYTFTLLPQTFTGSQTKALLEWFCVGRPRKEQVLNSAPTQHRSEPGGVCADEGIPQISGSLVAGVRATGILRGTPWRPEGCLGVFQPIHLHRLHLGRKWIGELKAKKTNTGIRTLAHLCTMNDPITDTAFTRSNGLKYTVDHHPVPQSHVNPHDMIKRKQQQNKTGPKTAKWANENHWFINLEKDWTDCFQIFDNFNSDYILGIEFFFFYKFLCFFTTLLTKHILISSSKKTWKQTWHFRKHDRLKFVPATLRQWGKV